MKVKVIFQNDWAYIDDVCDVKLTDELEHYLEEAKTIFEIAPNPFAVNYLTYNVCPSILDTDEVEIEVLEMCVSEKSIWFQGVVAEDGSAMFSEPISISSLLKEKEVSEERKKGTDLTPFVIKEVELEGTTFEISEGNLWMGSTIYCLKVVNPQGKTEELFFRQKSAIEQLVGNLILGLTN